MSRSALASIAIIGMLVTGAASAADMPAKAPAPATAPPPFFLINDNSISYSYQFTANNPGAGYTPKHVLTYTHFDVWKYGTNLINVDWLKATNGAQAPTAPCGFPNANVGCEGFTEFYAIIRSTLGWNQLSGTKTFLVGTDLNTDNTNLRSAKRTIEAGLQFDFAAPYKGFFNVGVVAYKEWQTAGDIVPTRLIGTAAAIVNGIMFLTSGLLIAIPGQIAAREAAAGTPISMLLVEMAGKPLLIGLAVAFALSLVMKETYPKP